MIHQGICFISVADAAKRHEEFLSQPKLLRVLYTSGKEINIEITRESKWRYEFMTLCRSQGFNTLTWIHVLQVHGRRRLGHVSWFPCWLLWSFYDALQPWRASRQPRRIKVTSQLVTLNSPRGLVVCVCVSPQSNSSHPMQLSLSRLKTSDFHVLMSLIPGTKQLRGMEHGPLPNLRHTQHLYVPQKIYTTK
jgi:hypothetical protein